MGAATRERRTPRRMVSVLATLGLVSGMLAVVVSTAGAAPSSCDAQNLTSGAKSADLQWLIGGAGPGDTIRVKGTCKGNFTIAKDGDDSHDGVDLTLLGKATLDGAGIGTVLHITHGTIAIQSLTITHGLASVESFLFNDGQSQKLCCSGGGIAVEGLGTEVLLTDSLVTANVAAAPWGRGGGIDVNEGTLTLSRSTVSGNTATNAGAIDSNFGKITLDNSTVSGNVASGVEKFCQATAACAGGIWNYGGTLTLNNSTISGNTAYWRGGGIVNQGSTGVLTLSGTTTITANAALYDTKKLAAAGGGIYQRGGALQPDWRDYVWGNSAGSPPHPDDCYDQLTEALCE